MEILKFTYPEEEVQDHPSDVGLEVEGADLPRALTRLIEAFYGLQLRGALGVRSRKGETTICAPDRESLVVRLLSELLFKLQGEREIFLGAVREVKEDGEGVCAELSGRFVRCSFSPGDFIEDIKAVTYHQIDVYVADVCRIRVFFDI